ncbi:MAG: maleylpyruvate isomerase family mycothiol-dependent enzyme [Actinomycetota bacterium]
MSDLHSRDGIRSAIRTERAVLADEVETLTEAQWATRSLCDRWTVQQVVAHLTAGASVGALRWFASVVGARFDFDLHNERRMSEHVGDTPADTVAGFRAIENSTTSAPGPAAVRLGEIVVHAEDIRRPLGLTRAVPVEVVTVVADLFASGNYTVPSRRTVRGLRLEATDGSFTSGDGPSVTGTTLALTMAMAGRSVFCDDLSGPGVDVLRERIAR